VNCLKARTKVVVSMYIVVRATVSLVLQTCHISSITESRFASCHDQGPATECRSAGLPLIAVDVRQGEAV